MIGMGKDMGIRCAGSQDTLCLFNCALELLASPAPESEQELLELVKKAKHDADKYHPPVPTAVKKPSRKSRCCGSCGLSIFKTLTEPWGSGCRSWKWPTVWIWKQGRNIKFNNSEQWEHWACAGPSHECYPVWSRARKY